jgi:hypothetical protein
LFGNRPLAAALSFFLSQQSSGYDPCAKRSRSATRAGLAGYLFETTHNAIAPIWQPGAYIRSRELGSVVEGAHSDFAHEAKGWLEHEIGHAALKRRQPAWAGVHVNDRGHRAGLVCRTATALRLTGGFN